MTIFTCPVSLYEGEIELFEYLNYRQLAAYERAMIGARRVMEANPDAGLAELRVAIVPGLIACVKSWRLKGLPEKMTAEEFPSTPRNEAGDLYLWILDLVKKKVDGEDSAPK